MTKKWRREKVAGKVVVLLAGAVSLPALGAAAPVDMAELSIEELANIQITSVSRRPEPLAEAAASVFVITSDDLRRAGVSTLAEALRLAPNLQVAQVNAASYAISARGLNGSNATGPNKLQVLIDGRSSYSPLFSGVFWDAQDLLIEDIERIEVISGPGGTLWGVNAVNGVINVITKEAGDTRGTLTVLEAGTRGAEAGFRYGSGNWRVYGKHLAQGHTELASGAAIDDGREQSQVGFRADWQRGADTFSLIGDAYHGHSGQPEPGALAVTGQKLVLEDLITSGVHVNGSWRRALAAGGSLTAQASLERSLRSAQPTFSEAINLVDAQLLHTLPALGQHQLVWGASYRRTWDEVGNSPLAAFLPPRVRQDWYSLFAQDELSLRDNLDLTVGARSEHNPYTGAEFLPTVRLAWTPAPAHLLWAGLSRTVRAPARLDADTFVPGKPPYILRGGPAIRSEVARVAELGYRGRPLPELSYSVTVFHNRYDDLRTQQIDPSRTFLTFTNLMEGKASGIEMWGSYQAGKRWRLSAGYTALRESMWLKPGANDTAGPGSVGKDPRHTAQLRSTFEVAPGQQFELAVRDVGSLRNPAVPAYTAVDARYLWLLRPGLELSLTGENLNGSHAEYGQVAYRTEVPRSAALRLVWRQ